MRFRIAKALTVAAALSLVLPAQAEVSISTSTDPSSVFDGRLTRLLGAEKTALSAVGNRRLEQLVRPVAAPEQGAETGPVTYSKAWIDAQPKASGGKDLQCLSEALYFEARGESIKGQFAVAEVILNRVSSSRFPDSVCGVIHQGTGRKYQCQFTYTCDGHAEVMHEAKAQERAAKIARIMLDGGARELTSGATYYHTHAVSPRWSRKFTRTASIGFHYFYRPSVRVSAKN